MSGHLLRVLRGAGSMGSQFRSLKIAFPVLGQRSCRDLHTATGAPPFDRKAFQEPENRTPSLWGKKCGQNVHTATEAALFDRKSFQESGNRIPSFWDKHFFKMCTQLRELHGSIENHFRWLKIALAVLAAKIL